MIKDTVKQALLDLFPEPEPAVEEPVVEAAEGEEAEADAKKAAKKKEEPRENGLLERVHAEHGYDLDVQVDPDDVPAAVTILDKAGFFLETITGVDWIKEAK